MALNRRELLATGFRLAAAKAAIASLLLTAMPAQAQSYDVDDLMAPSNLEEIAVGSENAPVTVIEYFSLTCGHCANFHKTTYKDLKEKYIDTGKVRFVLREFPLDPYAHAAAKLVRCTPGGKSEAMISALLATQRGWAYSDNQIGALFTISRQAGFTEDSFKECLTNQQLHDDVTAVRERGEKEFGVRSTPTFFVNGEKHTGALSSAEFDKILEPLLN